MRKKIVAGNWKMNLELEDALNLCKEIAVSTDKSTEVDLMIFPPAIYLYTMSSLPFETLEIGAQNFYPAEKGAYTGEISITQLSSIGVKTVLIGHSERRAYFGEHSDFLKRKVDSAIENGFNIVFCCGEPLNVREENNEMKFVKSQLIDSLFHLDAKQMEQVTIAYEPVWAIGTGLTATIEQAEEMHSSIRNWLTDAYSIDLSNKISILYGGSCNPDNAKELFACPNVDGGLIGGASLERESFLKIANSF
ncbi:MAG: triose-phosphate isomerase [Bacteroidetes bacterium]|nr:triose-phosphate isomerase [Bacteroidota bacterium]